MKAIWNETVLAESEDTVVVEGNHYFPPDSIKQAFFSPSDLHTVCPWKGKASYYDLEVAGQRLENAAWYYPDASEKAQKIEHYVAFGGKVKVVPS